MRQALELALEALERSVATCFDQRSHDAVMGRPEHFVNQAITAIKEALAQPEQETPKGWKSEIWKSVKQQEQEPVTWGVDWGKAGDIPCVSIIKRVPNGGIEVMAVEYAPYSYTTPPKQEPVRIMGFDCVCGRRMMVSAEQGVVPAPQRTWVGLTKDEVEMLSYKANGNTWTAVELAEDKLKQKNGYAEEKKI